MLKANAKNARKKDNIIVFSHPDYNRRFWNRTRSAPEKHREFMDYTIGREFHPAPKTIQF